MLGEEADAPQMRRRRDLWLLRGMALVISILLWITVLGGKKVEMSKKVSIDYQLPKGLVISNQVPTEVTFRVSGPRAFLKEFMDKSISLPIDLASARRGDYEVNIREEMLDVPLGVRVVSVSQSTIPIKLDRMSTKRVPIRAAFSGQLPDGLKVKSVTLQPSTVEIEGANSRIQTIDAVSTEPISLSIDSIKDTVTVPISMMDLPGINIAENDKSVKVSILVEGALNRQWVRNIPVGLKIGTPPRLRTLVVKNTTIKIYPSEVNFLLEGAGPSITKIGIGDIDVWAEIPPGKSGELEAKLVWTLPPGVRIVKRSADSVRIVLPQQTQ